MIHRRKELMSFFISKIRADLEEIDESYKIKFAVGYIQLDNQSETEPAMAVIVRPRDLYYDKDKIEFKLERETEKERQEREEAGLDNLTSETAKMFLLEIIVDKKAISSKLDVVYIDSISFLVQTLQIKI